MQVGGAQVCITPPHPISMGGYAAREGSSIGTHDELYVRCLYLEDEGGRSALLTYDLICVPESFVERVKQQLDAQFGIAANRIVLHATHTHSGPDVGLRSGTKSDPRMELYTEMLVAWSASACLIAIRNAEHVSVTTNTTVVSDVGGVRRTGANSPLPLRVVGFIGSNDKPKVVLVTFPCHPTVMGADNRFVSADYPGACIACMKSLLGPGTVVLFLNGASGDISTRFTRRSQTFSEVERFGCLVGAAATSLVIAGERQSIHRLSVACENVTLPTQTREGFTQLQALEESARAALANEREAGKRRIYETQLQGIAFARQQEGVVPRELKTRVCAWGFDGIASFVFWAGEPFFGYDQQLRQALGDHVTLIGYSDGMVGYIPDVTVEEDTAYEVFMSLCGRPGGVQLVQTSVQLVQSLAMR
jgi:neutral ceramidase